MLPSPCKACNQLLLSPCCLKCPTQCVDKSITNNPIGKEKCTAECTTSYLTCELPKHCPKFTHMQWSFATVSLLFCNPTWFGQLASKSEPNFLVGSQQESYSDPMQHVGECPTQPQSCWWFCVHMGLHSNCTRMAAAGWNSGLCFTLGCWMQSSSTPSQYPTV